MDFAAACEVYRRQLRAHCYRMLGSVADADDAVQETMLRAWRGREGFEGRSLLRTWLYRIATHVCLNVLERSPRRVLPADVAAPVTAETPASEARAAPRTSPEIPWLSPFPDAPAPRDTEPDAKVEARESVQLAFVAALQLLPPRQRAALVLCEVVGWSAEEVAEMLETTVAAVNSALGRARETVRAEVPAPAAAAAADREVLRRFMEAWERGDVAALTALFRDDARWSMPPAPLWFDGRAAIARLLTLYPPRWQGRDFRMVPVGANGQPAAAAYLRLPEERAFRLSALHVLRVVDAQIAEITTFGVELCAAFQLPAEMSSADR